MSIKNILITVIFVMIVAIPFVTKPPEAQTSGSVRIIKDLNYAGGVNPSQTLDLFVPSEREDKKALPLVIFIHGGAWIEGSKENSPALWLAQQGFAAASLNYRLSREAANPAQIDDVREAVAYLRRNVAKYNIDATKFGAWGISAGGHLAALIGTTGNDTTKTKDGVGVASVQAVADWCGISDLTTVSDQAGSKTKLDYDDKDGPVSIFLGGLPAERSEVARLASPVTHISADDPPFLLVHGDIDDVVPFAQSKELYQKLAAAGVPVTLKIARDQGHMFGNEMQMKRVVDFFKQTLVDGQRNFSLPD